MLLRHLDFKYDFISFILKSFNCINVKYAHLWAESILEDGVEIVLTDQRGRYERTDFYEMYPELETEAKLFALINASKKNASFTVKSLAIFITERFQELTGEALEKGELIRSCYSCNVDLIKWGAKWDDNKNRPYFEGHERIDVVLSRKAFLQYFTYARDLYYTVDNTQETRPWIRPFRIEDKGKPRILISHDESTFRSGETQSKRWIFPESAPLDSKGRGRSIMLSYFIICSSTDIIFELNEQEWNDAISKFPLLDKKQTSMNFFPRSASAWIEPGKNNYFDNEDILEQFERFFILCKFKKSFENYDIEILVDNARTHSAKFFDLNATNKGPSIKTCPIDKLEWMENEENKSIDCNYYEDGIKKSKGLFMIAKELKFIESNAESKDKRYLLPALRTLMSTHPAFKTQSKLEVLASKFNIKIVFVPKYHCELNPIEGFWCYVKQYVRKRTDQKFETMQVLIYEGIESFKNCDLNKKLWNRYWKAISLYNQDYSYEKVLQTLFGAKSYDKVKHHK